MAPTWSFLWSAT